MAPRAVLVLDCWGEADPSDVTDVTMRRTGLILT
jgi:hypothetical protein